MSHRHENTLGPSSRIQFVLIGNPENRRVAHFQQALCSFGMRPAVVVSYRDLLVGDASLENELSRVATQVIGEKCTLLLRIESPGENFDVERRLIALGCEFNDDSSARISAHAALRLQFDRGKILYPRQWYSGFVKFLDHVQVCIEEFPRVRPVNCPRMISVLFDKSACQQRLSSGNVPTAASLGEIVSLDQLLDSMRTRNWTRVFAKLRWGSSASGVMAIYHDKKTTRAVTSAEVVGSGSRARYYNSLKLNTYTRVSSIRSVFEFLCREGVHVERWLPKASLAGRQFDLRIVTIGGRAKHCVVRTSTGPITNLHLGNKRGDVELLKSQCGPNRWANIMRTAEHAAEQFELSHCLGVDLLLQPGFRNSTILEVNAFGDLLPNVVFENANTYQAQVGDI